MLDGVYVDARDLHSIVMIRPKAPFRAVFETAVTSEWSGVELIRYEPQENTPGAHIDPCSWWRRGRVGCSLFATNYLGEIIGVVGSNPLRLS